MCLSTVSRRFCSTLPGAEVRLASLWCPKSAFFCKWGLCFPFSSHWELPQMAMTSYCMESGLATSYDSSLGTHRCISSVPMHLCTFSFLRWSQAYCPMAGAPSFCQSLLLFPFITWVECLEHFLVKTDSKTTLSTSVLHIHGNQISCFLVERAHVFPLPFSYHQCICWSFFCCPRPLGFFSMSRFMLQWVGHLVAARGAPAAVVAFVWVDVLSTCGKWGLAWESLLQLLAVTHLG